MLKRLLSSSQSSHPALDTQRALSYGALILHETKLEVDSIPFKRTQLANGKTGKPYFCGAFER